MTNEIKTLIGIFIATAVILGGGVWFMSRSSSFNPSAPSTPADPAKLVRADSISRGPADAKVTLVEFGDFQCPSCAQAVPIVNRLYADYKDKVRFVFRHFPLGQHAHALKAAEAAESANDQGKFWEMFDKIYQGQSSWESLPADKAQATFRQYAEELGLDMAKFDESFKNDAHKVKIQSDYSDGASVGVNATPTFYLNNTKVEGVRNYDDFKARIDEALK